MDHIKAGIRFIRLLEPVCLIAICVSLEFGADAGPTGISAAALTVSEYSSKDLSLIMQVRAARVFVDYEHWGFFRIGLLPMLMAEDVQVKIQSPEYLANALADLESWHQPAIGCRHLELRSLEIIVGGEKQPRLRAAVARIGSDGALELSGAVVRDVAGRQLSLPRATLQIPGPTAGRLCWNSGGYQKELSILQTKTDKMP